jgi:hypothetical protein
MEKSCQVALLPNGENLKTKGIRKPGMQELNDY